MPHCTAELGSPLSATSVITRLGVVMVVVTGDGEAAGGGGDDADGAGEMPALTAPGVRDMIDMRLDGVSRP